MKYDWIDAYCLAKNGAEKDYKAEWQATRYMFPPQTSKVFVFHYSLAR